DSNDTQKKFQDVAAYSQATHRRHKSLERIYTSLTFSDAEQSSILYYLLVTDPDFNWSEMARLARSHATNKDEEFRFLDEEVRQARRQAIEEKHNAELAAFNPQRRDRRFDRHIQRYLASQKPQKRFELLSGHYRSS